MAAQSQGEAKVSTEGRNSRSWEIGRLFCLRGSSKQNFRNSAQSRLLQWSMTPVKWIALIVAGVVGMTAMIIVVIVTASWWVPALTVKIRQGDVEPYIKRSGDQFSQIADDRHATESAAILAHILMYYRPGDDPKLASRQASIEKTRSEAVAKISAALVPYSGTNFGTNVEAWISWATNRLATNRVAQTNLQTGRRKAPPATSATSLTQAKPAR
jgi:hypothetical protein